MNINELKIYGETGKLWDKDKNLEYCMGGAGYLLSRKTLNTLLKHIKYFNLCDMFKYRYQDVYIGIVSKSCGVRMSNSNLFHSQRPSYYIDKNMINDKEIMKQVSFHYITPKEMNELYINIK